MQQNEVLAKISVTEDEAHAVLRGAPERIHYAVRAHAARNPHRGAERPIAASTWRRTTPPRRRPRTSGIVCWRASRSRGSPREVSDAHVEGATAVSSVRSSSDELAPALQTMLAKMKVGDVVGRHPHPTRVPDPEARVAYRDEGEDVRRRRVRTSATGLREEKRRGETQKYLEKLRAEATITWKNDELKKAYEQALAERRKQLGTEQARPSEELNRDEPIRRSNPAGLGRDTGLCSRKCAGTRSGRARATSRSCASSSSRSTSKPSCRPSPGGAAGRIARRRSTGRCFPATASRASIRASGCRS